MSLNSYFTKDFVNYLYEPENHPLVKNCLQFFIQALGNTFFIEGLPVAIILKHPPHNPSALDLVNFSNHYIDNFSFLLSGFLLIFYLPKKHFIH